MTTGSHVSAEEKSVTNASLTTNIDAETRLLEQFFPRIDLVQVMVRMGPSMKAMTIGYLCSQGLLCAIGIFEIYSALIALSILGVFVLGIAIIVTLLFERIRKRNLKDKEVRRSLLNIIYLTHPELAPK